MTRKDSELIAKAIKEAKGWFGEAMSVGAIHSTAMNIADKLAQDNPRFDRIRFLNACGFNPAGF